MLPAAVNILLPECVLRWVFLISKKRWMPMKRLSGLLLVVLVSGAFALAGAQSIPALESIKSQAELTQAITALDKQVFDAYNTCNIEKLGTLVTDDLEFYHDKTGLAVGKQPFLDAIKKNICGKVTRELVPGSLEVYPLHGYGAVEIGLHRFHHPGDDKDVGEAKFVQLWQYKDGAWKISRVISYDHGIAK
jgi:hypothetical protein